MAYTYEGYKWNGNPLGTAGGNVTWSVDGTVPASFENDLAQAFRWSDYGNITFTRVASSANITFTYGNIDGPLNVAGRATTSFNPANGRINSVNIILDSSENWTEDAGGVATSSLSGVRLSTVALHEVGHGIGLGHIESEPAIMNSVSSPAVNTLQASDIEGVQAIYGVVCYGPGTLIRTIAGDVAVEDLRIGDLVVTGSGEHRPVRWLGQRTVACRQHPDPRMAHPVRIARDAIGPNRPCRDLTVSPEHAVAVTVVDEVLVPAHRLVNGATIAYAECETITYWHVELDSHDILIANGLPAESYIDCGNRSFFTGCQGEAARAPSGSLAAYCRPLADETVVRAVRSRLRARALDLGWQLATDPLADLHVVADGRVVRPDVLGTRARFVLPVDAQEVWLMSDTGVPAETGESGDIRRLGVSLSGMSVDDGLTGCREIALDDPRLGEGFHVLEEDGARHRWTDGRARLPASLWAGCRGQVFVRVELLESELARWVPPAAEAGPKGHAPRLVWSA
jgi:hypothetical protein